MSLKRCLEMRLAMRGGGSVERGQPSSSPPELGASQQTNRDVGLAILFSF